MKAERLVQDLGERLELPGEALGASRVTVTAGQRILVENHRGIQEYGEELSTVGTERGKLRFFGTQLRLEAMNGRELLIVGKLRQVEWDA